MVSSSLSSHEKAYLEYWRVKRLTKTTEPFYLLTLHWYLVPWNMFSTHFKPPFLISLTPSPTRSHNMLIKMNFSELVLLLLVLFWAGLSLWSFLSWSLSLSIWLSLFWPLFLFCSPWKHWKPFGFLVFPGDIKWGHWLEMDWYKQVPNQCYVII